MANNSQWKHELSAIIRANNVEHAVRSKDVSFNTQQARLQGLFRIFALLRTMGFHMAPHNLSARHIEALMSPAGDSAADPGRAVQYAISASMCRALRLCGAM
jgi:hypothetical protein